MRYVIRYDRSNSYYRSMKPCGPDFSSQLADAHVFESMDEVVTARCSHLGFANTKVEILDEYAYEKAVFASLASTARRQYLGVLGLLAACAPHIPEELRTLIEEALTDAQAVVPSLKWRRTLNTFTVETTIPTKKRTL